MTDMLDYVRDMQQARIDSKKKGRYTSQASRTAVGANEFGSPTFIASTLPSRDAAYFQRFIEESDPAQRKKILQTVPKEMARALTAQWVMQQANIARAEDKDVPPIGEGGRLFTEEELAEYAKADTKLGYGDYLRSKEVAQFFESRNVALPEDPNSPLYDPSLDYEDVKLKIVQQEGYDAHDFGLFDDRAALLWRKPCVDSAVRELTGSDRRSVEIIRRSVEEMILQAHDKNPHVSVTSANSKRDSGNVRVDVNLNQEADMLRDMRRNPEEYQ